MNDKIWHLHEHFSTIKLRDSLAKVTGAGDLCKAGQLEGDVSGDVVENENMSQYDSLGGPWRLR